MPLRHGLVIMARSPDPSGATRMTEGLASFATPTGPP